MLVSRAIGQTSGFSFQFLGAELHLRAVDSAIVSSLYGNATFLSLKNAYASQLAERDSWSLPALFSAWDLSNLASWAIRPDPTSFSSMAAGPR
jgi:hypothetical protein